MTTEEMNRVIAAYLGWETNKGYDFMAVPDSADPEVYKHKFYYSKEMLFHKSFDWLMPVWQKLRGELNPRQYKLDGHFRTDNRLVNLRVRIKEAITEEDTPATAHRLMVEAIELIKK